MNRITLIISELKKTVFYSGIGVLVLIGLWQGLVYFGSQSDNNIIYQEINFVKSAKYFLELIKEENFWKQVSASFYRIGIGFIWILLIGVPMGLLYSRNPYVTRILYLPFQFLRMISPLSWMPLAILLFGSWDQSIIFLIVMAALWPIIFNIKQGVEKINPGWLEVGASYRANVWQQLKFTILPAVAQDLATGLRLALGVSWVVIVPAEYLGVTSGLGYAINDARDTLDYTRLMALLIAIGILGYLADAVLGKISERFAWK